VVITVSDVLITVKMKEKKTVFLAGFNDIKLPFITVSYFDK